MGTAGEGHEAAMPAGGRLTIETAEISIDEDYCARNLEARPGGYRPDARVRSSLYCIVLTWV